MVTATQTRADFGMTDNAYQHYHRRGWFGTKFDAPSQGIAQPVTRENALEIGFQSEIPSDIPLTRTNTKESRTAIARKNQG